MKLWAAIRRAFRKYFLIGLLVFLPFAITIKFLIFVVEYFDDLLAFKNGRFLFAIPERFHPDFLMGIHVPGLGILLTVILILLLGALSRNYLGKRLISFGDSTIIRIPVLRAVYKVVRDAIATYSKRDRKRFSKVVLIEYPRPGIYTIAFVTGEAMAEVEKLTSEKMLSIFLPTTPNPTSGFYLMIPASKAVELKMSVEDALKLIISGGMVSPDA
jgi:uncharacterized membrane protein